MKTLCKIVVSVLLGIVVASCSFLPNELKQAESLIETAPDSALHILQHLSPDKYKSDESRALYGLLMIEALDRKKLPLQPDSLLDFSIAYYQYHSDDNRLATCYLYKGRTYKYNLQYEKAMFLYLKAIDAIKVTTEYRLLGRINLDLGDIYNAQRDYSLARKKYKAAYQNFLKAKFQPQAFYSLINIGRTYLTEKKYIFAENYYRSIIHIANDSIQKGELFQEISINFYASQKTDSALKYARKVIMFPYIGNNKAIRCYYLADLYFDLKKYDSAYFYAKESFKYNSDIRTQKECYRILVNCSTIDGNIAELNKFMAKYQDCADSIQRIDIQTKGSVIETIHTTKQEVVKTKQWVWNLIIAIFIIIIVGVFSYLGLRKRKEKEFVAHQQKHKEEKETLHKEVMLKYSKSLLQKIENKKAEQSEKRKKLTATEKDALDMQLYNELLHINDSVYFFKLMDTNLNNLVTKLRDRYIAVSDREISWCCLTLLNIPYPDILLLLNSLLSH